MSVAERPLHQRLLRLGQANVRRTLLPPRAFHRNERERIGLDEQILIDRRKRHHGPRRIRIAQRREDLPADAEVRMVHVRRLDRICKTQREFPEVVCGHSSIINRHSSFNNRLFEDAEQREDRAYEQRDQANGPCTTLAFREDGQHQGERDAHRRTDHAA